MEDFLDQTEALFLAVPWLKGLLEMALVTSCAVLAFFVTKRLLLRGIQHLIKKSGATWDDAIAARGALNHLAWLVPVSIIHNFAHLFPAAATVSRLASAGVMIIVGLALGDTLSAANDIYIRFPISRSIPIKGYIQVAKILLFISVGMVVLATLLDRSPVVFISGLGAMTAILMLLFKDTLLAFVASIQLATNDLLRIGDWIAIPGAEADGEVIDIALHTVKVRNWDLTITAVPTQKLIEQPFKNWRGMQESGGRRIMRSLHLDQNSVRFSTEEELDAFEKIEVLKSYVRERRAEIRRYNQAKEYDPKSPVNGRKMTNLGTFRAYIESYLKSHPRIHQGMPLIVRQLEAGPVGIPIQLYCFAQATDFGAYEGIQADVFDHLLAALPSFQLNVYQKPAGRDLLELAGSTKANPSGTHPAAAAAAAVT